MRRTYGKANGGLVSPTFDAAYKSTPAVAAAPPASVPAISAPKPIRKLSASSAKVTAASAAAAAAASEEFDADPFAGSSPPPTTAAARASTTTIKTHSSNSPLKRTQSTPQPPSARKAARPAVDSAAVVDAFAEAASSPVPTPSRTGSASPASTGSSPVKRSQSAIAPQRSKSGPAPAASPPADEENNVSSFSMASFTGPNRAKLEEIRYLMEGVSPKMSTKMRHANALSLARLFTVPLTIRLVRGSGGFVNLFQSLNIESCAADPVLRYAAIVMAALAADEKATARQFPDECVKVLLYFMESDLGPTAVPQHYSPAALPVIRTFLSLLKRSDCAQEPMISAGHLACAILSESSDDRLMRAILVRNNALRIAFDVSQHLFASVGVSPSVVDLTSASLFSASARPVNESRSRLALQNSLQILEFLTHSDADCQTKLLSMSPTQLQAAAATAAGTTAAAATSDSSSTAAASTSPYPLTRALVTVLALYRLHLLQRFQFAIGPRKPVAPSSPLVMPAVKPSAVVVPELKLRAASSASSVVSSSSSASSSTPTSAVSTPSAVPDSYAIRRRKRRPASLTATEPAAASVNAAGAAASTSQHSSTGDGDDAEMAKTQDQSLDDDDTAVASASFKRQRSSNGSSAAAAAAVAATLTTIVESDRERDTFAWNVLRLLVNLTHRSTIGSYQLNHITVPATAASGGVRQERALQLVVDCIAIARHLQGHQQSNGDAKSNLSTTASSFDATGVLTVALGILINCGEQNPASRIQIIEAEVSLLQRSSGAVLIRSQAAIEFFCDIFNDSKRRWRAAQERIDSAPIEPSPPATTAATAPSAAGEGRKTYGRSKSTPDPPAGAPSSAPTTATSAEREHAQMLESQVVCSYSATLLGCMLRHCPDSRPLITKSLSDGLPGLSGVLRDFLTLQSEASLLTEDALESLVQILDSIEQLIAPIAGARSRLTLEYLTDDT